VLDYLKPLVLAGGDLPARPQWASIAVAALFTGVIAAFHVYMTPPGKVVFEPATAANSVPPPATRGVARVPAILLAFVACAAFLVTLQVLQGCTKAQGTKLVAGLPIDATAVACVVLGALSGEALPVVATACGTTVEQAASALIAAVTTQGTETAKQAALRNQLSASLAVKQAIAFTFDGSSP
jgi:hypothetical protein